MSSKLLKITATFVLTSYCSSRDVEGQPVRIKQVEESTIGLEVMKPKLKGVSGINQYSSVWFFSGRIQTAHKNLAVIAELPVVYFDLDDMGSSSYSSEFLIGNPLIGIEIKPERSRIDTYGLIGVRLPAVGGGKLSASVYGMFSDFDRLDAFATKQISFLIGSGGSFDASSEGDVSKLAFGITGVVGIPTVSGFNPQTYVKYYLRLCFLFRYASVYTGVSGVGYLSGRGGSLSERTEHQASIGTSFEINRFRPGIFVRFPIERELNLITEYVVGINLTFAFPSADEAIQDY